MKTFKRRFSEGFVEDICDLSLLCEDYETDNIDIEIEDPGNKKRLTINIKFSPEVKDE